MHHPIDRIVHTTAFVTPVVEHWLEREIARWVHPMKDRSDDPSHHERTLLPRSYISLISLMTTYITRKNNTLPLLRQVRSEQAVVAHACHGYRCRPSPVPLSGTGISSASLSGSFIYITPTDRISYLSTRQSGREVLDESNIVPMIYQMLKCIVPPSSDQFNGQTKY